MTCASSQHCKPIARIYDSYFIGGAYGNTTEKKIMKEILRNGIVNGELNVPEEFSMYKDGILSIDYQDKL